MRKHLYWGVVIIGCFVPDLAFDAHFMVFVMVILVTKTVEITSPKWNAYKRIYSFQTKDEHRAHEREYENVYFF